MAGLTGIFNPAAFNPAVFNAGDQGTRAPLYAQAGLMRADASRANGTSTAVFVAIDGVQYAKARAVEDQQVDNETLEIQETDGETPNTCSFRVRGFFPNDGQEIIITLGSINNRERLFAGAILTDAASYLGTPVNQRDAVSGIDYTWHLTRETLSQRWTNVSATRIAEEIIALAGRGFTARRVEAGLPIVDEFTVTNQTPIAALRAVADRIGAAVKVTYHREVRFGISPDPALTNPTPITDGAAPLTEMRDFSVTRDLSQVITRQPVEGGGSTAATPVEVGATSIPVEEISWYNGAGGLVVSGPQRLTYTGILSGASTVQGGSSTVDGGSTTVAARPAPVNVPSISVFTTSGTPDELGLWGTEITFVYSDGVESQPSPPSGTANVTGVNDGLTIGLELGDARVTARRIYLKKPSGSTYDGNTMQTFYTTPGVYQVNNNTLTSDSFGAQTFGSSRHPPSSATGYNAGATYLYVSDTSVFSASGGSARVGSQVFTYTGRSTASGAGALTGVSGVTGSISVGNTIEAVIPIGATTLPVLDTAGFIATGGSAQVGSQTFTYTGRSVASGPGTLTGIPASGTGSLTAVVAGGATVGVIIPAGSTVLPVTDTAGFSGSGGAARIGSLTFIYTGRSVASGAGNLTGIPASGAGSLTSAVSGGATVLVGAGGTGTLTGIPASGPGSILYAINQGDPVNVRVVVDDLDAQAAIGARLGGDDDGIIEGALIQDGRISETEARARGRAQLERHKALDVAISYATRDLNTHAARDVPVNVAQPLCAGTFRLRSVAIGNFQPARWPRRQVQASSDRFTLADLLRLARAQQKAEALP